MKAVEFGIVGLGTIGRTVLGRVTVLGWGDEPHCRIDPWRGVFHHDLPVSTR